MSAGLDALRADQIENLTKHWPRIMEAVFMAEAEADRLREALQFGFDLYGFNAPDGPWPVDKRREFDRLARAALALPALDRNTVNGGMTDD